MRGVGVHHGWAEWCTASVQARVRAGRLPLTLPFRRLRRVLSGCLSRKPLGEGPGSASRGYVIVKRNQVASTK